MPARVEKCMAATFVTVYTEGCSISCPHDLNHGGISLSLPDQLPNNSNTFPKNILNGKRKLLVISPVIPTSLLKGHKRHSSNFFLSGLAIFNSFHFLVFLIFPLFSTPWWVFLSPSSKLPYTS